MILATTRRVRTVTHEVRREARPRRGWLLLLAILTLGVALRLSGLERHPFEQDELYTLIESRELFDSPLKPGIEARPAYYLLQHLLGEVLAPSHLSLRLLPFLFGTAGMLVTWALGVRLFGPVAGAIATLLAATSPWHLHASGMARYWSLVYLLSALFFFLLLRATQTERPGHYLAVFAAAAIGILTHPTFLFPVAGAALGISLAGTRARGGWRWPNRREALYLWGPTAIVLVLEFGVLSLLGREESVRNLGGRPWPATLRLLPAMVEWMTPTVFLAGAAGAILCATATTRSLSRTWGWLALAGTFSTVVALACAAIVTDVYADYGISILPLVFVSAGGLVQLGVERMQSGKRVFATISALLLVAAVLPSTVSHLLDGMRFDPRPAFRRIQDTEPQLTVLSSPIIVQRHYAPSLRGAELRTEPAYLDAWLKREPEFWAVVPVKRQGVVDDSEGLAATWLGTHCRLLQSTQRPRLDYRMYRIDLYRCSARL